MATKLGIAVSGAAAVLVVAAAVGLKARAPENVRYCEAIVKAWLKSPASYQRAKYTEGTSYTEEGNPAVRLEYDAANGYGAMIRGKAECVWEDQAAPTYTGYPALRSLYMDYKKVGDEYDGARTSAFLATKDVPLW